MVKKGAVAAVTPGAPKPTPCPIGQDGGIETSLPTILTAPATPVAMKPLPDHESPDNPFFPDLQTIKSHLSNMYFTCFARDDKAFFKSEKNVQHTLGYMWNFVNVNTLVLEDPSGEIYDGSTVFLCKCMNQLSNSCQLWALCLRHHEEWHECCNLCYVTFRSRKWSEKQELELNVDWVHRTDPSSRVPIAVLSPNSRAERCRNLQKRVIQEKRKNERLELKFSTMNNIEFPIGDSFRDSLSIAYEHCNGNHEEF
jgi:hypothetical protein